MVLLALLCGALGAVSAHIAYVQSNLYILGDVTRRSRHELWDPLAFDLMGLLWGVVIGAVAAKLFGASPVKSVAAGLSITLLGIALVGGVSTFNRYRELYSHPKLNPPLILEYELRLPSSYRIGGEMPKVAELLEGRKDPVRTPTSPSSAHVVDDRIVLPGKVRLTNVFGDRILSFPDQDQPAIFTLLLHETPVAHEFERTEWQGGRVESFDLSEAQKFQIRYRVQKSAER